MKQRFYSFTYEIIVIPASFSEHLQLCISKIVFMITKGFLI